MTDLAFNVKFKALVPKYNKYADISVKRNLITFMRKQGEMVKKDFEKVTVGWEKKPKFDVKLHLPSGGTAWIEVGTDDKIFRFIDLGVKKHDITPKGKAISFLGRHAYIRKSSGETLASYQKREFKRASRYGTTFHPKSRAIKYIRRSGIGARVSVRISKVTTSGKWAGYVPVAGIVHWPGIKARNWSRDIQRKWKFEITNEFRVMIEQSVKGFYAGQARSIWEM